MDSWLQSSIWKEPAGRWVAHVDMDAFFASVEQHDDPRLAGLPLVVANSPQSPERLHEMAAQARNGPPAQYIRGVRGVVASASYEARAFGVRSAMPLARALVLCPDAVVLPGRFDRYGVVAAHLRRIWADFSPVIEPMSLDEAFLDMTGCELTGGPIRGIAERLKARIRAETGLAASVGIGSSKLVAKIASDLEKPDGLVIVPQGKEAEMLAPLPVRALPGVGPRTEQALASMGVTKIGEILTVRPEQLVSLFGFEHAAGLRQRAAGIDDDPVRVPGDPKSISNEITLTEDSADLAFLRSRLRELSERVAWRLRQDGYMGRCIYIKLRLLPRKRAWSPEGSEFARPITRRCTVPTPTDAGQEIFERAHHLLLAAAEEQGVISGRKVVRLMGVGVASLCRIEDAVLPLPAGAEQPRVARLLRTEATTGEAQVLPDRDRDRRLNASLDHIRQRFGFASITLGSSSREHSHDDGAGHSD